MKKLLALFMTLALAFTMAACTGSGTDTSSNETTSGTDESGSASALYETRKLTVTTDKAENDDGGLILAYFCDYITEHSDGAITFNISYGGTLCTGQEELSMIESDAVDIACLGTTLFADSLPLINFPTMVRGDAQTALDYYNYLCFENEETAALIQEEAAAHNLVYLGFQAGGATCWISTKTLTGIDDIKGIKFGAMQNQGAFEALGVSVVAFNLTDGYENLSKGVIDAATMSFNPTVSMRWYEVAKNYLMLDTYVAGSPFTVNLNTWNDLNENEQALFQEAADAATAYSMELATDGYESNLEILEEADVTINNISEEEGLLWYSTLFTYQVENCRSIASGLGVSENMETVLNAAAEFVNVDISEID